MILDELDKLLDLPAKYSVFGIPGDTLAHIVVGFLVYYVLARLWKKRGRAFLVIMTLEFIKALVISLSATFHSKRFIHAVVEVAATFVGVIIADFVLIKTKKVRKNN